METTSNVKEERITRVVTVYYCTEHDASGKDNKPCDCAEEMGWYETNE